MASQEQILHIERLVGYTFIDKTRVTGALTCAGVEEDNHDGNRVFARFGRVVIELYVLQSGYQKGNSTCQYFTLQKLVFDAHSVGPAWINDSTVEALRKSRLSAIAREREIDSLIRYSLRQGDEPPTDTNLSNVVCAIVGAIWLDSKSLIAAFEAVVLLGYTR